MSRQDPDEIMMRAHIQEKLVEFMKSTGWDTPKDLVSPKLVLVSFSKSGEVQVRAATGQELRKYVSDGDLQSAIQCTWSIAPAIACVLHNRDRNIYYACAYGRVYKSRP